MKKLIGVAALLLALAISIIYRQLAGSQSKTCRPNPIPTLVQEMQENLLLASLTIQ